MNSGAPEGQAVPAPLVTPVVLNYNVVTNPVISHERGKDRKMFKTSGTDRVNT